jgi:hypothetical protein
VSAGSCTAAHGSEPEFLYFYGAQESIPRNQFRQTVNSGGPVRQPCSYPVPSPHRLFKNTSIVVTSTIYSSYCSCTIVQINSPYRSRIHERTISLRFLGSEISLRVLRLEVSISVYIVYISNQLQTTPTPFHYIYLHQ